MAKNTKKSFSDNLSSILEYTLNEDNKQDNPTFLTKVDIKESVKLETVAVEEEKEKAEKRKINRKSFSEGLESFFKESIEEVIGDSTVSEVKRGIVKKGNKKAVGIEILLQRTLFKDLSQEEDEEEREKFPKTKRITFVLDIEKVEMLKNAARKEKKQMRQIVGKLIEEYLTHMD
jgi:hypothetical protein